MKAPRLILHIYRGVRRTSNSWWQWEWFTLVHSDKDFDFFATDEQTIGLPVFSIPVTKDLTKYDASRFALHAVTDHNDAVFAFNFFFWYFSFETSWIFCVDFKSRSQLAVSWRKSLQRTEHGDVTSVWYS